MSIGMCIYYGIYSIIVMNDKMKSKGVGKRSFIYYYVSLVYL